MKKFSVFIFTLIILITPIFFCNAADVLVKANTVTTNTVNFSVYNLPINQTYNFDLLSIPDLSKISSKSSFVTLNQTVNNSFNGLNPDTSYKLSVKDSFFKELASTTFVTLVDTSKVVGKLSSQPDNTAVSLNIKVEINKGVSYVVYIYEPSNPSAIDKREGISTGSDIVSFDNLKQGTNYRFELYDKASSDKKLSEISVTTNDSNVSIITYDLFATSVGLEISGLSIGKTYTAFIKADSESGNTTGFYSAKEIPVVTRNVTSYTNFNNLLSPNSAYIGGVVGENSIKFKTGATDPQPETNLDLNNLTNNYNAANALYDNSTEGTDPGQHNAGSRADLKIVIDDTKLFIDSINNKTIQVDVDRYNSVLQDAIVTFNGAVVGGASNKGSNISLASKAGGLVPDCLDSAGCGWKELMVLVNNVIKFLLFTVATPLVALIIAYAGWLYLSSGGSEENITKAKKILLNVVVGYIIGLAAWLIVRTIVLSIGVDPTILKGYLN